MSDELDKSAQELVRFLESEKSPIPLVKVIENYSSNEEVITDAIQYSINELLVNKVLDYPDKKWGIYSGVPLWHLKKLTKEEADELRNLPSVDLAIIRVLQGQNNQKRPGEILSVNLRTILREMGFDESETKSLWVEGWVDNHYDLKEGTTIEWCRLIPEDEKTEEYKRAEEEMLQEWHKKDIRRQYRTDVLDLASWICETLEDKPEGLPKDKIVEQLPKFPSEYIDDAFRICLEDEDIEHVQRSDDVEWYRLVIYNGEDDE